MPVRLLVDALHYDQWGAAGAVVTEVGGDAILENGRPVFAVRCRLATRALRSRGGAVAPLRKGMTFTAHFVVGRRSVWQALRASAREWVGR